MSEQTPAGKKICTKCGESRAATLEFYNADPKASDGFYPQCKSCRKKKRTEVLTPAEKKKMDEFDRREKAFQRDLDNPGASANMMRNAEIGIRKTIPTQRKALEKQIAERLRGVRAAELGKQQRIELEKICV